MPDSLPDLESRRADLLGSLSSLGDLPPGSTVISPSMSRTHAAWSDDYRRMRRSQLQRTSHPFSVQGTSKGLGEKRDERQDRISTVNWREQWA